MRSLRFKGLRLASLIYLNDETGLLRGYDEVQELPGLGIVGCEVRFADYRDIEGVQIPFKSTVKYAAPMGAQAAGPAGVPAARCNGIFIIS